VFPLFSSRSVAVVLAAALATVSLWTPSRLEAQTDLDTFMGAVIARRDDNWKKLQQYVLEERATIDVRGPGNIPLWGERRDFTWYIRDGFFVRSPLKVNGVAVSEGDRVEAERDYLRRVRIRDERRARAELAERTNNDAEAPLPELNSVDALIKQTREPQFISSAYFLRFKFETGKYALVGRETVDGRDLVRIEYYPERLFTGTDRRRSDAPATDQDRARDRAFQTLMNKVALVTLWVEPSSHQIVRYTFDNVGFDFLPAQWLVHIEDVRASMNMSQPFPDVWLPKNLEMGIAGTLAVGQFDLKYALDYHDYKQADVTAKVGIPER
jgi:hypothetical protein